MELAIKYNNAATNDLCAICGMRCDPQIPLALFLHETYHLVCDSCGEKYAPVLFRLLMHFYKNEKEFAPEFCCDEEESVEKENKVIDYFGGCPECGGNDGYLNIGRGHWFICHEHKTAWHIGSNLFSSWKEESEEEWKRNAELISDYKEVKPIVDKKAHAASTGVTERSELAESPESFFQDLEPF